MAVVINVQPSVPFQQVQVELDGTTFTLGFHWNDRAGYWFMDLMDAEQNPLVMGMRVVPDWPMPGASRVPNLPTGQIFPQDTSGAGEDPGLEDLGARVILVYFTNSEIQSA